MADNTVKERLKSVRHVILVLSGKGGVGKSSVAVSLARGLVELGHRVGLLDIDLCGPSMPTMLGLRGRTVHQSSTGWTPVFADGDERLAVMSIGFLTEREDDAVVWRGPKKTAMIKQFLADVHWGELDYLVIDTPPGTSDEHVSVVEFLQACEPDGAVLVTTPQVVALTDVRKELTFCRKTGVPILGVVENMSGFVCPYCAECTSIFSSGGGESMAREFGVPFLARLPIDPQLTRALEVGTNFLREQPASPTTLTILALARALSAT